MGGCKKASQRGEAEMGYKENTFYENNKSIYIRLDDRCVLENFTLISNTQTTLNAEMLRNFPSDLLEKQREI